MNNIWVVSDWISSRHVIYFDICPNWHQTATKYWLATPRQHSMHTKLCCVYGYIRIEVVYMYILYCIFLVFIDHSFKSFGSGSPSGFWGKHKRWTVYRQITNGWFMMIKECPFSQVIYEVYCLCSNWNQIHT